jgi:hypothetical protein
VVSFPLAFLPTVLEDTYSNCTENVQVEEYDMSKAHRTNGDKNKVCLILVGKGELGTASPRRRKFKCENNIKMNLGKIEGAVWRVINEGSCEHGNELSGPVKCW